MIPLRIVTPCSRPQNLHRMLQSITREIPTDHPEFRWLVMLDYQKGEVEIPFKDIKRLDHIWCPTYPKGFGGYQRTRSFYYISLMEDAGYNCWMYFLDDDNTLPVGWFKQVCEAVEQNPDAEVIYGSRLMPDGQLVRPIGYGPNLTDTGQVLARYRWIKDIEWGAGYDADGHFWKRAIDKCLPSQFAVVPELICTYNAIA